MGRAWYRNDWYRNDWYRQRLWPENQTNKAAADSFCRLTFLLLPCLAFPLTSLLPILLPSRCSYCLLHCFFGNTILHFCSGLASSSPTLSVSPWLPLSNPTGFCEFVCYSVMLLQLQCEMSHQAGTYIAGRNRQLRVSQTSSSLSIWRHRTVLMAGFKPHHQFL